MSNKIIQKIKKSSQEHTEIKTEIIEDYKSEIEIDEDPDLWMYNILNTKKEDQ